MVTKVKVARGGPAPWASKGRPCGYCGKPLTKTEEKNNFTTNCVVCSEKAYLHSKCAKQLIKNKCNITLSTSQSMKQRSTVFRQSQVQLWCNDCEDPCYLCNTMHTGE